MEIVRIEIPKIQFSLDFRIVWASISACTSRKGPLRKHIMKLKKPQSIIFRAALLASISIPSVGFSQIVQESIPVNTEEISRGVSANEASISVQSNALYLNQWVHVGRNQYLGGSVVSLVGQDTISLPKMRVSLVQDGNPIAYDDTDIEGNFLLEKVVPGRYTLVAESANLLSIFSIVVLDEMSGKHLPNSVQVRVTSTDTGRIGEILRSQTLPRVQSGGFPGRDPIGADRQIADSHKIQLGADNVLSGTLGKAALKVDMSGMTVYITKDGQEIKRARVGSDGRFAVSGMTPGSYGFVAAGDQGVAVTGFCAVSHDFAVVAKNSPKFVSSNIALASSINIELGDSVANPDQPVEIVPPAEIASTPMASGGMGPGFGGGMTGGGGGGGIGAGSGGIGFAGLAGIGGLVAVAAVVAANDNDKPVSPIVP